MELTRRNLVGNIISITKKFWLKNPNGTLLIYRILVSGILPGLSFKTIKTFDNVNISIYQFISSCHIPMLLSTAIHSFFIFCGNTGFLFIFRCMSVGAHFYTLTCEWYSCPVVPYFVVLLNMHLRFVSVMFEVWTCPLYCFLGVVVVFVADVLFRCCSSAAPQYDVGER